METIGSKVTISEATDADAMAYGLFLHEAWRAWGPGAPGFTGATDAAIAEIAAPDAFRARIAAPGSRMYLARCQDSIVGFAASRQVDSRLTELAGIVVLPSAVGRGVGKRLLEATAERARGDGFAGMVVRTEVDNQRAQDFYAALGFEDQGPAAEVIDGVTFPVREMKLTW